MKKIKTKKDLLPKCVGIIMDGNRRWARNRALPASMGQHAGYKKLKEVLFWAKDEGVKNIIVYAFSTENWKRSKKEIEALMKLFGQVLHQEDSFVKEEVRVTFIGQKEHFSKSISEGMDKMENVTKKCKTINLTIAFSYGGRAEIISAVNTLLKGKSKNISEKDFTGYLWTANIPDPDLIIRTGGENRLSNFLTWQSVYSELFFTDTYWPAFTKREFKSILAKYKKIEKRKGE